MIICYKHYTGCPQKSGTLNLCYFDIQKYSIFLILSDKTLSSEKKDHLIWFSSIDSTTISSNTVIYDFFF